MEHMVQNYTSVLGKAADMLQPWSAAAASLPQSTRAAEAEGRPAAGRGTGL